MIVPSFFTIGLLAALSTAAPILRVRDSAVQTFNRATTSNTTSGTSGPTVTNSGAFDSGAGNTNNANTNDGTGDAGTDTYQCYYGGAENFPPSSQWIEFDAMFNLQKQAMYASCGNLGLSPEDTGEQVGEMYNAIQQIAQESLVDHRFILATIMQESIGCVWVGSTASHDGVTNPGIMQSHEGVSYDPDNSQASITQMVRDGSQGTAAGDGLVQVINQFGNIYEAARAYNSGSVNSADLNDGLGATNAYVNDIANRMTGWLYSPRATC